MDSYHRLASLAFGFKLSQLRGVFGSRIAEGLRVLVLPRRPIRLVSWMRPPLGVVKLTVDGCSKGNPGMAALRGVLRDHRSVVLATFGTFLGCHSILYAELMVVYEGWSLRLNLVISHLRWNRIWLQLFLGSILEVLFVGSTLVVSCVLLHIIFIYFSQTCATRDHLYC